MEDERCDEESVVFNARVAPDEMIISIEEYSIMKNKIEELTCELKKLNDELFEQTELTQKFKKLLDICQKDNQKIKNGVINFFRGLGG